MGSFCMLQHQVRGDIFARRQLFVLKIIYDGTVIGEFLEPQSVIVTVKVSYYTAN